MKKKKCLSTCPAVQLSAWHSASTGKVFSLNIWSKAVAFLSNFFFYPHESWPFLDNIANKHIFFSSWGLRNGRRLWREDKKGTQASILCSSLSKNILYFLFGSTRLRVMEKRWENSPLLSKYLSSLSLIKKGENLPWLFGNIDEIIVINFLLENREEKERVEKEWTEL